MAIHFLPNDPLAGAAAPPLRQKAPRRSRPASRAGLSFHGRAPERRYEPGTAGFLYWQCRESALAALGTWEGYAGPLARWAEDRRRLHVYPDAVAQLDAASDLNAFYDRESLQFLSFDHGGKQTFAGASVDVVAHEAGHGILDALRPDLWETPFLEANAFHEAFGDCLAILTALDDAATRTALLAVGLGRRNFVETTAEDLSDGIRREFPWHNAAAPRRAWNRLRWQLPSSLPVDGGPGELINESHSFAQVFTGCFWDLVRGLAGAEPTSASLKSAARKAARLLAAGATAAPEVARFYQAVGRAMVLADGELFGGAHHLAIRDAFAAHGVSLGSQAMLTPTAALAGPSPSAVAARGARGEAGAALAAATWRDLRERLGAPGKARVVLRRRAIGGEEVVQAVHQREVALGELTPRLAGVVARAPESVLVGGSGGRAAVLGGLPEATTTVDEVMAYVESLVLHDRIDYSGAVRGARKGHARVRRKGAGSGRGGAGGGSPETGEFSWHTHEVRVMAGQPVLRRVRFACGDRLARRP